MWLISIIVLVSYNCHNKLPKAWWFKTIAIYSFTVLVPEVQNQSHRAEIPVLAGLGALQRLKERIHFLLPPASGSCWHSLACGHITLICVHNAVSSSLSNLLCLPQGFYCLHLGSTQITFLVQDPWLNHICKDLLGLSHLWFQELGPDIFGWPLFSLLYQIIWGLLVWEQVVCRGLI